MALSVLAVGTVGPMGIPKKTSENSSVVSVAGWNYFCGRVLIQKFLWRGLPFLFCYKRPYPTFPLFSFLLYFSSLPLIPHCRYIPSSRNSFHFFSIPPLSSRSILPFTSITLSFTPFTMTTDKTSQPRNVHKPLLFEIAWEVANKGKSFLSAFFCTLAVLMQARSWITI